MMSQILITGGTGNLGKSLTRLLDQHQIAYTIGSRSNKTGANNITVMDLLKNKAVKEAVQGKTLIFHLATDLQHDTLVTTNLLNAIGSNASIHLVYMSIVGIDAVPLGYYRQKLASEQAIKNAGIPFTILRATQFHEFIHQVITTLLKYPIGLLPKKMVSQPIQTEVVAETLLALSNQPAANKTHEMGGCEVLTLHEMANQWMLQNGKKRMILNLPVWGTVGKTLRNGSLTTSNRSSNSISWQQWLKQH